MKAFHLTIAGLSACLMLTACEQTGTSVDGAPANVASADTGTDVDTGSGMESGGGEPASEAVAETADLEDRTYAAQSELAGYYLPATEVGAGPVMLDHIYLGMGFEFAEYFAGVEGAYSPLMVIFEDRSSPTGVGELGNTYYEVTHVFEPSHYAVTDEGLAFWGQHDVLGQISFEGEFDAAQVAAMQNGYPENAQSALVGTITIGTQTFENVSFQGWLGD